LPTLDEAGLRGFQVYTWYGVLGPAGMPRPVVDTLNAAIAKGMSDEAVRQRLATQGLDVVTGTPEQFGEALVREINTWGKVVKQSGAKAD
jgi:tripartite-type tricarboxylate transporter receptor subunit TctC